jgi:hypothetical protein
MISSIPQVNISPVLHADECERIIKFMINKFWAVILPPPQAFHKKYNWWETNGKACGLIFQNGLSNKPNYI